MNEYLFSYGTLQKEQGQIKLFGRKLIGEKDLLVGYKTSEIEIKDEGFLAKGEKSSQLTAVFTDKAVDTIAGTVFEISTEELVVADEYEPDGYKRVEVELASGKRAWVYLVS